MINKTLDEFTKLTFSKEPAPGGGGVSGLVGSLAASLAGMVTSLTTGKKKYAEYEEEIQAIMKESEELRINLLSCIKEDADNFLPLASAYALPKDTPGYEEKMEACLRQAATTPFKIMELSKRVIELDERLAIIGSKLAISDAATSAMLAHGAIYGGFINVKVNTRLMKDKEYAKDYETKALAILNEYSKRAINCFDEVIVRLQNG